MGPQDCGGNPCCWRLVNARDLGRSCEARPDDCVPVMGVDTLTTRLCQADEDCIAGGVTTALTHCCLAPDHAWKACAVACSSRSP